MKKDLTELIARVTDFFKDDYKTLNWFKTPHPQLADMSPRDMIRVGEIEKLSEFIKASLKDNKL